MPTTPPHVRLPTSVPIFRRLNIQGIRSPPEPAISLTIITFGPQMPADGLVNGMRSPIFSLYRSAVILPTMAEVRSAIHAFNCSGGTFASDSKSSARTGSTANCGKKLRCVM